MTTSIRRNYFVVVCFTLATAFTSSVKCQTTSPSNSSIRPVLLFTGDSLTEQGTSPYLTGWVTLFQNRYSRSGDIITRGLSGYNTKWFLKHAMPVLEHEINVRAYTPPSLITVWLGTNDAVLTNGSASTKHVPVEDYKNNLVNIVDRFRTAVPDGKILLITPAHINDGMRVMIAANRTDDKRGIVDRSNAAMGNYSRACVEVAKSLKVPVLDMYSYFNGLNETARNSMLVDGIHFSAAGNEEVYHQLRNKLNNDFPTLMAALDTWQIPAASQYEAADPWKVTDAYTS
ncbi:Isoamyl acetate-hydrolyzing esterase [Phytophthora megakarya]|uniref:Isoamyl acetate-hydrolyzing esterase n=1 Tax=Phytophthora megakarya TaxID=4795 RepID=A0A225WGK5_9STRA|nr:Isoamyl acetate-hydrolyzing esterase [Phytophthora megakarya]